MIIFLHRHRRKQEYFLQCAYNFFFKKLILNFFLLQYPFALWAAVALIWCTLVCTSRIYLGMHSLADILVGLVASASLLVFVVFIADSSDHFLLSNPMAPIVTIALSLGGLYFYPGSDRWTPAR